MVHEVTAGLYTFNSVLLFSIQNCWSLNASFEAETTFEKY